MGNLKRRRNAIRQESQIRQQRVPGNVAITPSTRYAKRRQFEQALPKKDRHIFCTLTELLLAHDTTALLPLELEIMAEHRPPLATRARHSCPLNYFFTVFQAANGSPTNAPRRAGGNTALSSGLRSKHPSELTTAVNAALQSCTGLLLLITDAKGLAKHAQKWPHFKVRDAADHRTSPALHLATAGLQKLGEYMHSRSSRA